jgi:hypothetical protein
MGIMSALYAIASTVFPDHTSACVVYIGSLVLVLLATLTGILFYSSSVVFLSTYLGLP